LKEGHKTDCQRGHEVIAAWTPGVVEDSDSDTDTDTTTEPLVLD